MSVARPLRGSVPVRALLFPRRLLGDAESRRRVLAAWRPGARVLDLEGDLLLVLADEVRLRCDRAPGLPFVRSGDRMLAATPAEPDTPPDAVVWPDAGRVRAESLSRFPVVDVASWLDPGPLETLALAPLARPQAALPRVTVEERPPLDARAHLGIPPAALGAADLRRQLLGQGAAGPRGPRLWLRWKQALRRAFARWKGEATATAARAARIPSARAPSWLARMRSRLAGLLLETRLAQAIGRRHAAYIRRMLDLFESGDVHDALRHAIPLGNDLETGLQSLALPRPRASLAIGTGGQAVSSALGLGAELYQHLHRTYRAMFERLKAQGRLEEAAFVLAELLRSDAEAVAFLETHGRLRLAAELAEGRGLPIPLQVRQWFLAGDRRRALELALRHGAFAGAALWLDKRGPAEEARAWRLLWADALAEAGDFLGAAEVAAGIPAAEHLVIGWLDAAIAQGGPTGARALVRKLGARPEAFAEIRERALALLTPTAIEDVPARVAFAEAVSVGRRSPALSTLARVAARTLVRDLGLHGRTRLPAALVDRMVAVAGDGALRADLPALPERAAPVLRGRAQPLELEWAASDVGRIAAEDAAFLPDGRVVVALGEPGIRLYRRDGRLLEHFDQPAARLVLSDRGDRALALAPRGSAQRIARVDLLRRQATRWCEAAVEVFAEDYDGRLWFVDVDGDLYAIDTAAPAFDAVWRVPELNALQVARGDRLYVLAGAVGAETLERFVYELPSLALRARDAIPDIEREALLRAIPDGKGDYALVTLARQGPPQTRLHSFFGGGYGVSSWSDPSARVVGLTPEWLVTESREPGALVVGLVERSPRGLRLRLRLAGASTAVTRIGAGNLTLADDRGRVIVIDLLQGIVLRDLRIA